MFSPEQLGVNVPAYVALVGKPEHVFYPVKANPSMAVLRELQNLGCGLDCATPAEVDLGLLCGFNYDRFIYNSAAPDYGLWEDSGRR